MKINQLFFPSCVQKHLSDCDILMLSLAYKSIHSKDAIHILSISHASIHVKQFIFEYLRVIYIQKMIFIS